MRFLIDMPLSPSLADFLGERGHDAIHAGNIGMDRSPDSDILRRAKHEARTIVTADLDYPRLLALARATEPSLILFRGGNWSDAEIISRMAALLDVFDAGDIEGSILVVDRDRVRRRRLPIDR